MTKAAAQTSKLSAYEKTKRHIETPRGLLGRLYHSQCQTSAFRGHAPPAYTREELVARYINDPEYMRLYQAWVEGGKQKLMKPSLDRLDESRGYSFDNIRLVTWGENLRRQTMAARRLLVVFSGDNLQGIYDSYREACEAMGYRSHNLFHFVDSGNPTNRGHYLYTIPQSLLKLAGVSNG
jgi:hypothetical protein